MIAEYNEYLYRHIVLMCGFAIPTIICTSVFIYFIVDIIKHKPSHKKSVGCKKNKATKRKKVFSRKEYLDRIIGLNIVLAICGLY